MNLLLKFYCLIAFTNCAMGELQKFVTKLFNKDLPTKWNINDKSDSLSISSDGLEVKYTGENI